jgi:integrase/recombinase XerD
MAKQKIGSKQKSATPEQKKERLQRQYAEWTGNEISIKHAYLIFNVDRQARGSTAPTIAAYDRMFKKLEEHIEKDFGSTADDMPVTWLVQEGAQLFFIKSLGEVSQQTVNHYLRHYRAFGNFCEEKGYIDGFKCPIKEVEAPIKQVYTDAELKKLLVKPKKDNFTEFRNYCIIALILATGARSHTIRELKIGDVDLENGYINYNTTKAHKVVRLGLEHKVRVDLAEYIAEYRTYDVNEYELSSEEPLFCNQYGEALSKDGLIKAVAEYNKRRGVEKTSIHLLRHTFAKNWITSGGDIISLAKVLTHSELDMVKKYANLYADDVKEEIEQHSTLSQLRRSSGKTLRSKK